MDYFDLNESEEQTPRGDPDLVWNILTVAVLVTAFCVGLYFLTLFVNPYLRINPFPPPTPLPPPRTPTPTITPIQLQPTWTMTATIQPSATLTPRPSFTPLLTNTPFLNTTPPAGATATSTPNPGSAPFAATINTIESTIIHPGAGCNWMGIGGDARDVNNSSVPFLTVRLGGTLDGNEISRLSVTGTAPLYGQAGFEFVLGDKPIASKNTLWIQLLDQAGLPLSERIFFSTFDDCQKNLVLIRFKKR